MSLRSRAKKVRKGMILVEEEEEQGSVGPAPIEIMSTSFIHNEDGSRSSQSQILKALPDSQQNSASAQSLDDFADFDANRWSINEMVDEYSRAHNEEEVQAKKKRKADRPLEEWVQDREQFLSEFIRTEGKDDAINACADCGVVSSLFRCQDCEGLELLCQDCILNSHKRNGLHWIEKWDHDSGHFVRVSLRSLGHSYQLGHRIGEKCPCPHRSFNGDFTIVDINGVHDVEVSYCGCEKMQHHYLQVLRFGWFPATVTFPRTAFTMRLLKFFQILSFESKTTVYELHNTVHRLTDNTGTKKIKDRYSALLRAVREYRHIKLLKRSGRGHDSGGAAGTSPGECAVLCPACPHPGINLVLGWEDTPPEKRYLHTLFLGMDANFRLKRRNISSSAADPSLSKGWAYFVNEDEFKEFLNKFDSLVIQEPSKCSNHDAVNKERGREGFAASGVRTCDCTRHDMKRPTSVGDLQKGERYVNMDFFFFSSLKHNDVVMVVVSYDIACQWSIHLWARMRAYPNWMHVDHENKTTFRFMIPKFHLPAHIRQCRTTYSFNYNEKVGRTDGEGVERGWSFINGIAASTKEMKPGSRRDTIDDHFGDWNWKKTTNMVTSIVTQIEEAVLEAADQSDNYEEFTCGLQSKDVSEWQAQLTAWHADRENSTNPFEPTLSALSQDAVRRQLAEEEDRNAADGTAFVMHEAVSASHMIIMGLEIENDQKRLLADFKALSQHATDKQRARWTLRSTILRRKISSWIEIQQRYLPSVHVLRVRAADAAKESEDEIKVYDITLFLPSSLTSNVPCDNRLLNIEYRLRYAQCTDSLDDLRDGLCLRSFVLIDKSRFQRGQRANTRSQGLVDRIQAKIDTAVSRYRSGRASVSNLARRLGIIGWENNLLELKDDDVRALAAEEVTQREMKERRREKRNQKDGTSSTGSAQPSSQQWSEGRRTVSWIWTRMGGESDLSNDVRLHESLRIEWCKSISRRDRWREEIELLLEERKRILAFFAFQSEKWSARAEGDQSWMLPNVPFDPVAVNGRIAFAREQAAQFREMRRHCIYMWQNIDRFVELKGEGVKIRVREENWRFDGFDIDRGGEEQSDDDNE